MTPRQAEVLKFVEQYRSRRGCSPTLQEIADHFRIHKVTVLGHLRRLERSRSIRRRPYGHRAIEVERKLPVLGRIVAGRPMEAFEVPSELEIEFQGDVFALEVSGDSMIEDGIRDGDFVIVERRADVRDGEIVAALLEGGEVTLKRLYREGRRFRLQPANSTMAPIYADSLEVQGVMVGLYRKVRQ